MMEDREEVAKERRRKAGNSPLKAIRLNCLECSGGSYKEVENCKVIDCYLYPFRFGVRPNTLKKRGS